MQDYNLAQFMQIVDSIIWLIVVICVVWFILRIILFFKVWGMTNDVRKIKNTLSEWLDIEHPMVEVEDKKEEEKNN